MNHPVRVRFAPSPTGNVHIGNIRAAIFNYLFARHEGGQFLLRVEDTDLERSTPEAISSLMDVLGWLDLNPDEAPLFQSERREAHLEAVEGLISRGLAYRYARNEEESPAVFFRPPVDDAVYGEFLRSVGPVEVLLHDAVPVRVDFTGASFATVSKKGKPVETLSGLAGLKNLEILDAEGAVLFSLAGQLDAVCAGEVSFESDAARSLRFERRELCFTDLVKGELAMPVDAMKDLVIVRGDGSPVFHLANVCDDLHQGITHIIRGDDHVSNTYRHIPLILSLGGKVPAYGHLPMIVNQQGKPYSKRDGDAYVGDFRSKGYLPETLFNYLTLLGWAPGDDREKMNRDALIEAFTLDRVQRSAAQMDLRKLSDLNGQYLRELPRDLFLADVRDLLARCDWSAGVEPETIAEVTDLMRDRVQTYEDVLGWEYFFSDIEPSAAAEKRGLGKAWQKEGLQAISAAVDAGLPPVEALRQAEKDLEMSEGKLNLVMRVVATGMAGGADLIETLNLIGDEAVARRVRAAAERLPKEEADHE